MLILKNFRIVLNLLHTIWLYLVVLRDFQYSTAHITKPVTNLRNFIYNESEPVVYHAPVLQESLPHSEHLLYLLSIG